MRPNLRTAVTSGAAWTFGVLASVGVGVVALSLIGDGLAIHDTEPLIPEGVYQAAAPTDPSRGPTKRTTPRSDPNRGNGTTETSKVLKSDGGFVVAQCRDDEAYLASWSPYQGFSVDDVHRGPAEKATLEFKSRQWEIHMIISCDDGTPKLKTEGDRQDKD